MALVYLANLENKLNPTRDSKYFQKSFHFPTGLGIISGVLSLTDHEVKVLDNYTPGTTLEMVYKQIEEKKPDYILFSGFLGNYQYSFFNETSKVIRNVSPNTIQIIGGPMATTIPELLLTYSSVDYVVTGEGEETILDLLNILENDLDVGNVKGIAYRNTKGSIVKTLMRERIRDLSKFPLPRFSDFNLKPYLEFIHKTDRAWDISASRGCYARCKYCRLTFENKLAFRPVWHVLHEMNYIAENFHIDHFSFVDDNFLNSPRRVNEFISALKNNTKKFRFRFQGRADRISKDLALQLRSVGCVAISFGLESGSQKIIDSIGKQLDITQAEENVKSVIDVGVIANASFVVGMPDESPETIEQTKQFIKRIGLNQVKAGILTPFPDTEIYELAKQRKLITDDHDYCSKLGVVYQKIYANFTKYSDDDILRWTEEIDALAPWNRDESKNPEDVLNENTRVLLS